MRQDLPLRFEIAYGLIGIVLLGSIVTFSIKAASGAFEGGYELTAVFDRVVAGFDATTEAKQNGVTIGKVERIELERPGRVVVTVRIHDGIQLPDTTVASVEPLSAFGPKFLNLVPGDHAQTGPYLPPGGEIARTEHPGEFLETIGKASHLLQTVSLDELATILNSVSAGLDGLGPELGQTIDNGAALTDLLARHTGDFSSLVGDIARITGTLSQRSTELAAIASDLHAVVPLLTARPGDLVALLDATGKASATLADLIEGHGPGLDGTINGAAGVVDALYQQLGNIPDFFEASSTLGEVLLPSIRPFTGDLLMAVIKGYLPVDQCFLLVGLCEATGMAPSSATAAAGMLPPFPPATSSPVGTPPTAAPPPPAGGVLQDLLRLLGLAGN